MVVCLEEAVTPSPRCQANGVTAVARHSSGVPFRPPRLIHALTFSTEPQQEDGGSHQSHVIQSCRQARFVLSANLNTPTRSLVRSSYRKSCRPGSMPRST